MNYLFRLSCFLNIILRFWRFTSAHYLLHQVIYDVRFSVDNKIHNSNVELQNLAMPISDLHYLLLSPSHLRFLRCVTFSILNNVISIWCERLLPWNANWLNVTLVTCKMQVHNSWNILGDVLQMHSSHLRCEYWTDWYCQDDIFAIYCTTLLQWILKTGIKSTK